MNTPSHQDLDVNALMSQVREVNGLKAVPPPSTARPLKHASKAAPPASAAAQESFNQQTLGILNGLSRVCGDHQQSLVRLQHATANHQQQITLANARLDEQQAALSQLARKIAPVYVGNGRLFIQTAHGLPIIVPAGDLQITSSLITTGAWDPALTNIYQRFMKNGMAYLEIGAHVGYFTTLAAALVGHHGKVHAFEPNPAAFDFLESNVRLNSCAYISKLVPQAASNQTGRTRFNVFARNGGSSTLSELPAQLLQEWREQPSTLEVNCTRLDDFYGADTVSFDFIKMDAEGAEPLIFEGGARFFRDRIKPETLIAMEFNPPAIQGLNRDPRTFARTLFDAGFKFWRIADVDDLQPVSAPEQLDAWCITELLMTRAATLPAW